MLTVKIAWHNITPRIAKTRFGESFKGRRKGCAPHVKLQDGAGFAQAMPV
jgi:hypothetical protein